jgi:hypothetical protein
MKDFCHIEQLLALISFISLVAFAWFPIYASLEEAAWGGGKKQWY